MNGSSMQRGAALLLALLTVALIAALSSSTFWLQWRQVEVEGAERTRTQASWLMTGAFDWGRHILYEDGRAQSNSADHLGEPWALRIQEFPLSSFLSDKHQRQEGDPDAFMGGGIEDAQSRLNVTSLLESGRISRENFRTFARLFEHLGLPLSELQLLATRLQPRPADQLSPETPLLPRQLRQLTWLGLSRATLARLEPFITLLPEPTPVNLNTASAEVLHASVQDLDMAQALRLVSLRNRGHWSDLEAARKAFGSAGGAINAKFHAVNSKFFEIRGHIRLDDVIMQETELVQRDHLQVRVLWRRSDVAPYRTGKLT